ALRYPYYADVANVVARRKPKPVNVPADRWYEDLWRENDSFSYEVSK
ncbi:hypothetical protein CEXT_611551, partial [Caerostris extrusa]